MNSARNPLFALAYFKIIIATNLLLAQSALPPLTLPGDATIAAAAGDQKSPEIAQGGSQFLAVWADARSQTAGETATGSDIYAMRIDASGNPIEPLPFVVTQAPADQTNPRVIWNGQNWLVVWETLGTSATGYYSTHLNAARVSPEGVVLDKKPLVVHRLNQGSSIQWTVATDGANWAVVWEGSSSGESDVLGVRVSPAGEVLDNPPVLILPGAYYLRFNLKLDYSQGTYLLVWSDLNDLQGLRLGTNLQPLDTAPLTLVKNNRSAPLVAGSSNGFFLLWSAPQTDYTSALFGSRVTLSGSLLEPNGINISLSNRPATYGSPPDLVWNGSVWMATWAFGGISVARITPEGVLLDPGGHAVAGVSAGPAAPSPLGGLQVVWSEGPAGQYQPYDVKTAAVSATFAAGPQYVVSLGAPSQASAGAASGGAGWMVVYRSATSDEQRILAQPLDGEGVPGTVEPIVLASGPRLNGPGLPAVAWNGSYFLVVWADAGQGGVFGRRLLPNGAIVDATPFFIMPGGDPDVAALGRNFLVVSVYAPSNPQFVFPFATRVRGDDGVVLDPAPIQLGQYFSRWPAVSRLGNRWLVTWQRNVSHDDPHAEIDAAFVGSNGVAEPAFLVTTLLTGSMYRGPAIATSGNNALITWEDERISNVETEIVGRRILPDGTWLDGAQGIQLTAQPGNQFRTAVAWNGREYVVAYQDQRNRISSLDILDSRTDIFVTRVSEAGSVIDPAGDAVAATAGGDVWAAAAGDVDGKTLIAASILQPQAPYDAFRIGYAVYPAGNRWPIATASGTPASGAIPLAVDFSAAGSTDLDGMIGSYVWDFGDGTGATGPSAAHIYDEPGFYVATLTVTDNAGASAGNTVLVQAKHVNQPPVAVAAADPVSGPAPLSVVLYATGSYDPDGQIGVIHWTFSDGGDYFGTPAYHTFQNPGAYTATLTVTDNDGATGTTQLTIEVGPANQPPVAIASASPTVGSPPLAVQFSSAGSYDPDGAIASYAWDFGDGTNSTLANPSHTYTSGAVYNATLTVTDNQGAAVSAAVRISVDGTPLLRSIGISIAGKIAHGAASVKAVVTVADQSNLVVSGAVVVGRWTLPDGTTVTQWAKSNRRGDAAFLAKGPLGLYSFTVLNITKAGYQFDSTHGVLTKSVLVQ